jgi:hypothetical protein
MPSRKSFWVILVGATPTAFRADERDELLPTLRQLQRKHADVTLRWFARGRIWNSQVEEHAALKAARMAPRTRGGDWRPGGTHKDPRARYEISRDEKRARFKQRLRRPPRPGDSPGGGAGRPAGRFGRPGGGGPKRRP